MTYWLLVTSFYHPILLLTIHTLFGCFLKLLNSKIIDLQSYTQVYSKHKSKMKCLIFHTLILFLFLLLKNNQSSISYLLAPYSMLDIEINTSHGWSTWKHLPSRAQCFPIPFLSNISSFAGKAGTQPLDSSFSFSGIVEVVNSLQHTNYVTFRWTIINCCLR